MTNIYYGKLENNELIYAQNPLWIDGKMISNPKEETYIQQGYKPIEYAEQPNKEGYYFILTYADSGNRIIQGWQECEIEIEEGVENT